MKVFLSMMAGIVFGNALILAFSAPVWAGVLGYAVAFDSVLYMLDRK